MQGKVVFLMAREAGTTGIAEHPDAKFQEHHNASVELSPSSLV